MTIPAMMVICRCTCTGYGRNANNSSKSIFFPHRSVTLKKEITTQRLIFLTLLDKINKLLKQKKNIYYKDKDKLTNFISSVIPFLRLDLVKIDTHISPISISKPSKHVFILHIYLHYFVNASLGAC